MAELTFAQLHEQEDRIRPWVEFIMQHEGSELGDKYEALDHAVSACISASDYDTAKAILDCMEADIKNGLESGWIKEIADDAQEDWERWLQQEAAKPVRAPQPTKQFSELQERHSLTS